MESSGITLMVFNVRFRQEEGYEMSRIEASISFDMEGKHTGYLRVPYSSHASAYGWIPLPLTVIQGAARGPRVLLLGGVHGDEYEGQIALAKIARSLESRDVAGTLTLLSSTNLPAALANNRLSPVDNVNLNRAFPGDASGTPTQMIAHYIEEVLLPTCDYVIDLHSGGSSLDYLPCVRARLSPDTEIRRKTLQMVQAFDAEFGVLFRPAKAEPRTMSAACERKGVVYINPETGGGARVGRAALQAAHDGTLRCLLALGMIESAPVSPSSGVTRTATLVAGASLVYSDTDGVWEPLVELGEAVASGQALAAIYNLKKPWLEPQLISSSIAGTVLCRRAGAWVELGDCLFEIGVDFEPSSASS
jgi:uncharacterized protein